MLSGVAVASPSVAATPRYDPAGGRGHVHHYVYGKASAEAMSPGAVYDYLVYTPVGWNETEHLPVYVALTGCGGTAEDMMGITWLNAIADRERFLAVYPGNLHATTCWHAVSDDALLTASVQPNADITRGAGGEVDMVAGITKQAAKRFGADNTRVYLGGFSAGAFQTSATAAAYPELYAAIAVLAGGGPGMAVTCAGYSSAVVPSYATWAVAHMGKRAHVMPFFVEGGDLDPLGELGEATPGPGGCAHWAYLEWLYIDNLLAPSPTARVPGVCGLLPPRVVTTVQGVDTNECSDTFLTNPDATRRGKVPAGRRWTRHVAQNYVRGCGIGEEWITHGMAHTWPGPSGDPVQHGDPRGIHASELSWAFLSRFTIKTDHKRCSSS